MYSINLYRLHIIEKNDTQYIKSNNNKSKLDR